MNSIDNLDCDYLESTDDFILTRCLEGSSVFVWRYYQNSVELDLIDEIDFSEFKEQMGAVIDFKMKGKIVTKFS